MDTHGQFDHDMLDVLERLSGESARFFETMANVAP